MLAHTGLVMTLANSIIGVGILAMPFCFQKCGILLSIVLLIVSNWITRVCCHYLIKSSLLTRRKSFEFLGFHAFGSSGKLLVELCIIGYLLGTCITYFVVVGDLGPQIITKMFTLADGYSHLRTWFMFAVTIFCILPLGMLKNVDSLSTVCTASIGFYVCLVIKIILESENHILANDWSTHVVYWQPSGVLQCLPIFSMALSCQMQLFEVFKSVNNQSVDKLNGIVRDATWICTFVYIAVGFFGYVAFCTQPFSGNILMNFSPSFGSDVIKIGFILSVAFSFPLVIFPCRASIYSLLYRKGHTEAMGGYIPEGRFKTITTFIVGFALCVALMIPSVELIIGLVGSTIGVAICIMFPAACFRKINKKNNSERSYSLSSFIILSGFCLMVLGTYANLQAIDERGSGVHVETSKPPISLQKPTDLPLIKQQILQILDKKDDKIDVASLQSKEDNPKLPRAELKKVASDKSEKLENVINPPLLQQMPAQAPILPVDEIHVEGQKKEVAVQQIAGAERIVNKLDTALVDVVKPLNSQNQSNNVVSAIPEKSQAAKIQMQQKIEANVLSKPASNNDGKTAQQTIDKDAIKKDEDMAAEESKNNEENKSEENELKKTQNELKKTKELLERKVDEIKEELAKQNKETQNLVVEKLVEVVEKVEEIEREVHKQELIPQPISTRLNSAHASPEVHKKDEDLKLGNKSKEEINTPVESKSNIEQPKGAVVKNKSNFEVRPDALVLQAEIDAAKPKSLLDKLTAPQADFNDLKPKPGQVYEPLSYKAGELIEQVRNVNSLEQRLPLPLALLINSSRIHTKDEENLNKIDVAEKETILLVNKTMNPDQNNKENIEAIRRDILQLSDSQNPTATVTELSNSHQRMKRELDINMQKLPKQIENAQHQENFLIEPKIESLLESGLSNALDFKRQVIGRDLKSLQQDHDNEHT